MDSTNTQVRVRWTKKKNIFENFPPIAKTQIFIYGDAV